MKPELGGGGRDTQLSSRHERAAMLLLPRSACSVSQDRPAGRPGFSLLSRLLL